MFGWGGNRGGRGRGGGRVPFVCLVQKGNRGGRGGGVGVYHPILHNYL